MTTQISGLKYVSDYIDDVAHDWIINKVDQSVWLSDLKRRVQHYGYKYDYRARKINQSMHLGELPEWLKRLSSNLFRDGHINFFADQVIVNEYMPGQGISAHVDCEPCFNDTIISLSLGSACVMRFTNKFDRTDTVDMFLEPKSLIVLTDDARYKWTHSIPARRTDLFNAVRYNRSRRISLTFRKVIL